jgi:hypothetical protein
MRKIPPILILLSLSNLAVKLAFANIRLRKQNLMHQTSLKNFQKVIFAIIIFFTPFFIGNAFAALNECQMSTIPTVIQPNTEFTVRVTCDSSATGTGDVRIEIRDSSSNLVFDNNLGRKNSGYPFTGETTVPGLSEGNYQITTIIALVNGDTNLISPQSVSVGSPSPTFTPPTGSPTGSPTMSVPGQVTTGLGTFSTDPEGFVGNILTIAFGIAGGIAFILIIFGAIRILTSTGDPEAVNQGREVITSAIVGLLFIIFATFILRLIGLTLFQGVVGIFQ